MGLPAPTCLNARERIFNRTTGCEKLLLGPGRACYIQREREKTNRIVTKLSPRMAQDGQKNGATEENSTSSYLTAGKGI